MTQLKVLRKKRKETQDDIATLIGITRGAYANIENGKREPDFDTLITLADHFNVSIDFLLGRESKKAPTLEEIENEELTEQEQNLIRLARELRPEQQVLLISILNAILGQNQKMIPSYQASIVGTSTANSHSNP